MMGWAQDKYSSLLFTCILLVFAHCSKLLYDITSNYGTSAAIVQAWIRRLNEKIHGAIRYTKSHLRHKLSGLKGGRARERFLCQTWKLQLQPDETDASDTEIETLKAKLDSSEKERTKLQETVEALQTDMTTKVQNLSSKIKHLQSNLLGSITSHTKSSQRGKGVAWNEVKNPHVKLLCLG